MRTLIGGASATIGAVAAQVDAWLGADGTASIVDGALQIRITGAGLGLGLRDEAQAAPGSARTDAAIAFDADADGQTDETVLGFSAFFGLNDLFIDQAPTTAQASAVVAADFAASAATLSFRNASGAIATVAIAAGDDLAAVAGKIATGTGLQGPRRRRRRRPAPQPRLGGRLGLHRQPEHRRRRHAARRARPGPRAHRA
ncbi:MAG: hypothetical protein ACXW25_08620, partial [Rhodospirillales bacterium]